MYCIFYPIHYSENNCQRLAPIMDSPRRVYRDGCIRCSFGIECAPRGKELQQCNSVSRASIGSAATLCIGKQHEIVYIRGLTHTHTHPRIYTSHTTSTTCYTARGGIWRRNFSAPLLPVGRHIFSSRTLYTCAIESLYISPDYTEQTSKIVFTGLHLRMEKRPAWNERCPTDLTRF